MKFDNIEFFLKDSFLEKYKRKYPNFGPLGYFVFARTYSRPLDKGTESWWQTVRRVVEGSFLLQKRHCKLIAVPWNERQAQRSAQIMYDKIFNFKFLPPGRGLWAMGTDFVFKKGSAALNNCAFCSSENISDDFSGPFTWAMDMSMFGVGVGFDTKGASENLYLKEPRKLSAEIHIVEDSREGWVEAFKRVLDAYVRKDTLPRKFDFSQIRPAGASISGFGGFCPGSKPLEILLEKTTKLLDIYLKEEKPVDSTLIVDLMNIAGEAVVSGGIRRSSEISLGNYNDLEFISLKDSNRIKDKSRARWASNNSIFAEQGMDYNEVAQKTATTGEPGYFWLENARAYGRIIDGKNYVDERVMGGNPCLEQTLWDKELCCLAETFVSRHNSLEEYKDTLKYAYLYGKSVTLLPTHCERTNAVMFRNRRIGLSQTGVIENINRIGFRNHINWCDTGYKAIKEWDRIYSDWLCIPKSIKTTTVKPSGSVSLLPGVTPGIHFPHSEYYIRRIRVSKSSNIWGIMKEAGYKVEADHYETENTMVVEFPIHEPNFSLRKDQVSIWEQLELAAQMQAYWSDNSVSITCTIPKGQEKELPRALSMYESRLKSVSFLPIDPNQTYTQAPYESISKEQFEKISSKLKKYKLEVEKQDRKEEKFCDSDSCSL